MFPITIILIILGLRNLKLFDLASNCFGPQLKDLFKDCLISVHEKVSEEVIWIVHDWTTDDIAY